MYLYCCRKLLQVNWYQLWLQWRLVLSLVYIIFLNYFLCLSETNDYVILGGSTLNSLRLIDGPDSFTGMYIILHSGRRLYKYNEETNFDLYKSLCKPKT